MQEQYGSSESHSESHDELSEDDEEVQPKIRYQAELYAILTDPNKLFGWLVGNKLVLNNPPCSKCNQPMKLKERERNLSEAALARKSDQGESLDVIWSYRCTRGCNTRKSPRTNTFLASMDSKNRANVKISYRQVIEIIWSFSMMRSQSDTRQSCELECTTISDWYCFCRELMMEKFDRRQKMGGEGFIVEIDEMLPLGKRKANRGRYRAGDQWVSAPNEAMPNNDDPNDQGRPERYRRRMRGPWIFGLVLCRLEGSKRKVMETRFFIVERRNSETLIPIINNEILPGTTIYSDEWPAYNEICHNFNHVTINHSRWYVDPQGNHSNTIEGQWLIVRKRLVKDMRGTSSTLLPSYLCEFWLRSIFPNRVDFFNAVIGLIQEFYPL